MAALEELGWNHGLEGHQQAQLYAPAPLINPAVDPDSGSEKEDLSALLPKRTVVLIRGNARTRGSLIGMRAVVRRAVGLGGWHWLVLPSGEEIKLQRNALEVLERPTGNEQDFSDDEEEEMRRQQQHQQQSAAVRGYAYEPAEPHAEDRPRPPRRPPSVPPQPRHEDYGSGSGGAGGIAGGGSRTRPHASRSTAAASSQSRINLSKLQTSALKRYSRLYHLPEAEVQQASREQLLGAVAEHFAAQEVDENEVIACFLNAVKRHRMGLQR